MDHSKYREQSNVFRDRVRKVLQDIEDRNGDAGVLDAGIDVAIQSLNQWKDLAEKHFPEYFQAKYPGKYFDEYFATSECQRMPLVKKPSKR